MTDFFKLLIELLQATAWPGIVFFCAIRFGTPIVVALEALVGRINSGDPLKAGWFELGLKPLSELEKSRLIKTAAITLDKEADKAALAASTAGTGTDGHFAQGHTQSLNEAALNVSKGLSSLKLTIANILDASSYSLRFVEKHYDTRAQRDVSVDGTDYDGYFKKNGINFLIDVSYVRSMSEAVERLMGQYALRVKQISVLNPRPSLVAIFVKDKIESEDEGFIGRLSILCASHGVNVLTHVFTLSQLKKDYPSGLDLAAVVSGDIASGMAVGTLPP